MGGEVLEKGTAWGCGGSWFYLDVLSRQPLVAEGRRIFLVKVSNTQGYCEDETQIAQLCGIIFRTQHHPVLPALRILIQLRENNLQISHQYLSDLKLKSLPGYTQKHNRDSLPNNYLDILLSWSAHFPLKDRSKNKNNT